MKTRYKILIVIAITLFVFVGLRLGLIHICNAVSDECEIFYDFFVFTSIHLQTSHIWDTGDGIATWEGTEGIERNYEFRLEDNVIFFIFFVIIPISMISTIVYRDRK